MTISNSPRIAKSMALCFVLFASKDFFNLLLLLLPFLSKELGATVRTIRPFALKGHGSIAHSTSPHGLLTSSPQGLRVLLLNV